MKKVLACILAMILIIACVSGCSSNAKTTESENTENSLNTTADGETGKEAEAGNYKIVVLSDTVTQGEEAYRTVEQMVEKYGEDRVIHGTYPDKASSEQETTISNIMSYAADPDVKAIIAGYAVEGTTAAFQKVREVRPDILLLAGGPSEDPIVLSPACDLVVGIDMISMGTEVADTASKMGATTLVHYSFPRHMANSVYLARHDAMKARCEELGITFVDGTTPDPMAEAGVSATQQYIFEDVPRKVEEYGKDTAFFSTNVGMHEALIKSIYECGALFPHPDTPSPFYCYPGALGIEVPADKAGDAQWMCDQISAKLRENGMEGRMGVWMPSATEMIISSLCEYAFRVLDSNSDPENYLQVDVLNEILSEFSDGRYSANLYTGADVTNYYGYISDTYILG